MSVSPMSNVRIGLVGLGRLGKKHAANLLATPHCELAAVCSIVPEELAYAKTQLGVKTCYDNYNDLLADSGIDAVFLVTSTSVHAEQIVQGLQAGKHVFCEKPLALSLEACEDVVTEAKKYPNQIATIGFVRRFDPSYAYAHEQIQKGVIGEPILFRSQTVDLTDFAEFQVPFTATSGGFAHDMLVHDLDLARWYLGGEMQTAYVAGGCYKYKGFEQYQDIDNATALCQYDNGRCATFFASRTATHGHDTRSEIIGTEGQLRIGQTPAANSVSIYDRHGARQECVQDFFARFEEAFRLEVFDFVGSIREGRAPRCGLQDAMQATRGAIALTESFRRQSLITL